MKKSMIAGASAVALAAMPVVGVFADDLVVEYGIVKDNVTVVVDSTCSVTSAGTAGTTTSSNDTINRTVNFGVMKTATSRDSSDGAVTTAPIAFKVNCNGAWHVVAKGAGGTTHEQDLYKAATTGQDATPEATIIGNGTHTAGQSFWQFKVTGTNTSSSYNADYVSIPDTTGATVASSSTGVDENQITPAYKITLAGNQTPGTYNGAVSYTLVANAN